MQIDVVRHLVVGMILQMKFHDVALANANEAARDRASEGPEGVTDALGNLLLDLAYLQFHDDLGRLFAISGGRDVGWRSQDGVDRWTHWLRIVRRCPRFSRASQRVGRKHRGGR